MELTVEALVQILDGTMMRNCFNSGYSETKATIRIILLITFELSGEVHYLFVPPSSVVRIAVPVPMGAMKLQAYHFVSKGGGHSGMPQCGGCPR